MSETKATEYQEQCMVNLFMEYGMDRCEASAMTVALRTHEAMNEMLDWMEAGNFKQTIDEARTAAISLWKIRREVG